MEKWNDIIKGLDKYDKMLAAKEIYKTITNEKFEEVTNWLSTGKNKAEWLNIFPGKKTCQSFFLECARNNFPEARNKIKIINEIMNTDTFIES